MNVVMSTFNANVAESAILKLINLHNMVPLNTRSNHDTELSTLLIGFMGYYCAFVVNIELVEIVLVLL